MDGNYWSSTLRNRVSRRRAIVVTGGAAAAAAFLAACGGSNSSSGSGDSKGSADKSGLVTKSVDTSKEAKRGGTLRWFQENEPAHLDIHTGLAPLNRINQLVNSNLVNEKPGIIGPPEFSEVVPDLAQSWEWSPDRLTLTMKLRPGVKWHNKAPVNGRAMDPQDIVSSWNRFAAKGQGRGTLANVANPNAPVLGVSATDANTIVWKLKDPVVYFLSQLTPAQTGNFWPVPKETDGTFDNRKDLIGTGPFVLTEYKPSIGMSFERNKEYWDAAKGPYFDKIDFPFILEYAQAIAQLKTGNIFTYNNRIRQEDVTSLKKETPDLQMYLVPPESFSPGNTIQYGVLPSEVNKPFKDDRVRQALSMAIDRDAYIDVFRNVQKFQAEGLPVKGYWYTSIGEGKNWRLDPNDSKFGPNAKYYKHDIAEAKKLLAAAGYAGGVDIVTSYISGTQLGPDFQKTVEVRQDMLREAGVRPKVNLIDYTLEYLPKYLTSAGKFDGLVYRSGVASANDAVTWLDWRYKSGGGDGWIGFDLAGKGDGSGDPEVDSLILKARSEVDTEKRRALVHDLQRYLAKAQWAISEPGIADSFELAWPALANYRAINGDRRTPAYSWWLDETKAPLKKS
jgi:peptide/nickel transport system substrate-binding protein